MTLKKTSFAKLLRQGKITKPSPTSKDLVLLLENIYDTYNVGGMYRVADSAGVAKIYHCGQTPPGPDPKISRAAVGLDQYIAHAAVKNIVPKIKELKKDGFLIVSLEQTPQAKVFNKVNYQGKVALISGNETFGVSKEALSASDLAVEIPMFGVNKSLNVVVATGIVLYQIRSSLCS
jgi:23S rRNA (guanosine2251-2'-O)-methyltransferase